MYDLCRKLLFQFSPELSHELALDWLSAASRLGVLNFLFERPSKPVRVMGLNFPNPVGLAAGLDKNGDYYQALAQLGFGFVEIGTVTPKAQVGNPKPRLFRLPEHQAIINRMGFNNFGVDHLVNNVSKSAFDGILGINIGKNKTTPEDQSLRDYALCMDAVYAYADYITINISSPNTPGLRNLQFGEPLDKLLTGIQQKSQELSQVHERLVPIAVKVAPDMTHDDLRQVADMLVKHEISAVIATNTTISRDAVAGHEHADEQGGLSGAPLTALSTQAIQVLSEHLQGALGIIGVGGILSAQDAADKITAGADLLQLYSGFIYKGPSLIKDCVNAYS